MIQDTLSRAIVEALSDASKELGLDRETLPQPEITRPRLKEHGDWSTNVALVLAPRTGRPPRQVADALARRLQENPLFVKIEVAGPGFINLFLDNSWLYDVLTEIVQKGHGFGRRAQSRGERIQVEFVSANPTGPLHVGTARNAAIGDSLANGLGAAGYEVEREYYWNDTGTQVELFAASLEARYLEQFGIEAEIPEGGYQGSYLIEVARAIVESVGDRLVHEDPEARRDFLRDEGHRRMLARIEATLAEFGVRFDSWVTEGWLVHEGLVTQAVERLREAGYVYESEGATWFRSTSFRDDKDRVLIRQTGEPTYFAKDCAYLLHKVKRGFDRMVYVWGADHHGDVKRMKGAAEALGIRPDRVQILLYQLVSFYRGGEPVRMSKRTGDVVSLDELLEEVGPDAARYSLLTRSPDSPLDFDIEAVKRQSLDNPVYYVQYAHARISSLLRVAGEQGVAVRPLPDVSLEELTHEAELDLIRRLSEWPEVIEMVAEALAPHRLTKYAEQLAADFHRFYTECRVVTDDLDLTQARLSLCLATKTVVASALDLIGVSAPESMERLDDGEA
ncbi:MAG TPA: arginine--tRNA ligase [Actinomycetota bacterium]|nr:arginine--tRNA ligase [Actinomycetota bacterium]